MIAIDTNVLVRFLVEDDPEQSRRAAELFRRSVEQDLVIFVPDVVLVETVWVLERSYHMRRNEILPALRRLLAAREVSFASSDRLDRALRDWERGRGGFADYVIREQAREAGCSVVATFDRALLGEPGFAAP